MSDYTLAPIETRFAQLIWQNAPLSSGELVRLSQEALSWKKSTTYTVLRRLCQKGLFRNENGTVSVLIPEQEFYARQSEDYIAESFGGSLPKFLAAFTSRKKLSEVELAALQRLIDESR